MTLICRDCSEILNDPKTDPLGSFVPKPVKENHVSALDLAKFTGVVGALVVVSCFTGYFFLYMLIVGPIFFLPLKRKETRRTRASSDQDAHGSHAGGEA